MKTVNCHIELRPAAARPDPQPGVSVLIAIPFESFKLP